MGSVIRATAPELCQKCDFLVKKKLKEIFSYILEFMLTFDRMQNQGPISSIKFVRYILNCAYVVF